MFDMRYGWLPRRLVNAILFILLIQAIPSLWASDNPSQSLLIAGRRAFTAGNYKQAEVYFRKAVADAENRNAPDVELAPILNDLGNLLLTERKLDEAEAVLDRAVAILRSRSTVDKRQLPVLLGILGQLYQQTSRVERSEAVLREALQLGRKLLTDEPLYLSDLYNNIGVLHLRTGNLKQAQTDFKTALTLVEKDLNQNDARKAPILANLSSIYFLQQKWSMAEQTLLRSIDIVERTQGADHPNVCTLLDNLGFLYFKQNDLVRAEAALRRELAIRRTAFGPENVSTAFAAVTLANVLAARGNSDEAGILFAEALNTQEHALGRVPEVAETLDQFASFLRRTNREALAGDMESRAESIRQELSYTVSIKGLRDR